MRKTSRELNGLKKKENVKLIVEAIKRASSITGVPQLEIIKPTKRTRGIPRARGIAGLILIDNFTVTEISLIFSQPWPTTDNQIKNARSKSCS